MATNRDKLTYHTSNRIRSIVKMAKSVGFGTALTLLLVLSHLTKLSLGLSAKFAFVLLGLGILFLSVLGVCYWLTITRRVSRTKMWTFLKFLEKWPLIIFWVLEVLIGFGVFRSLMNG